jgi:hypothetical protein
VYRYRLESAAVELADYRSEKKLKVRDRIDEKDRPPLRVRKIVREPIAPFGLETRWLSRAGIAEVELDAPDPDTGAISKGMQERQF